MEWKKLFTPVGALDADAAQDYLAGQPEGSYTLLDVRQPWEYDEDHLPGATLIPLPELNSRLDELDRDKPALVYCAIGGRSRVASQVLAGKGFKEVFNLSGGIKAWNSGKAVGPEDLGLDLFTGKESPEETLVVAYGLEEGLRRFYESMAPRVTSENARKLFARLSTIEVKHQDRIFSEYLRATGAEVSREDFAKKTFSPAMEGGLTTEDYIQRYQPNIENPAEVISLAMAIEGQALDLYQRAADRAKTGQSRDSLMQIAGEERSHLEQLGKLFQNVI